MDGEYKIAQYGQWDGYPMAQGADVLRFLKYMKLDLLPDILRECRFATREDLEKHKHSWEYTHKHWSRDLGAKILQAVVFDGARLMKNALPFAGESLFCEWAYVIDLDKEQLEVYKGFNKDPVTDPLARFRSDDPALTVEGKYHPVVLVKSYWIKDLPTVRQMIDECDPQEKEDEDGEAAE